MKPRNIAALIIFTALATTLLYWGSYLVYRGNNLYAVQMDPNNKEDVTHVLNFDTSWKGQLWEANFYPPFNIDFHASNIGVSRRPSSEFRRIDGVLYHEEQYMQWDESMQWGVPIEDSAPE